MTEPVIPTRTPAVDPVTRELVYTSVSAMRKFAHDEYGGCAARWFFRYVEGRKEAQTAAQKVGVDGHTQLEHYLPTGEDVLGSIAAAGKHLLPAPGPDVLIEWGLNDRPRPPDVDGKQVSFFPPEQSLLRADGLPLIGFMDFINPRGAYMSPEGIWTQDPPNTVEAGDHKFISDVDEYAEPASKLVISTQMVGYAKFLTAKYPGLQYARVSHNSFQTRNGKKAKKTTALMSVEQINQTWKLKGDDVVRKMREVAQLRRVEDVPARTESCEAYRKPCDFQSICPHFQNRNTHPLRKLQMGLLKDRATAAAPAAPAVTNGVSTTPWIAPPPPPVAQRKLGIQDHGVAKDAAQGQLYRFSTGLEAMFNTAYDNAGQMLYSFTPKGGGQPFPVGPDEPVVHIPTIVTSAPAPLPPAPPAPPAPPVPPAAVAAPLPPVPPPPALPTLPAPVQAAAIPLPSVPGLPPVPTVARDAGAPPPPPPLVAQTEVKKGRGRPKGSTKEAAAAAATEAEGITLFVNAVPTGSFEDLSEYARAVTADMQEVFKVTDIRCAADDSHLGFAKWKGHLATAVRAQPPAAGTYVAFTRGNEVMEVVAQTVGELCGPGQFVRGV